VKFWCWFGWHRWLPDWSEMGVFRRCLDCQKRQVGTYDMCYGGTIWTDV